jgi:hypothetical protein
MSAAHIVSREEVMAFLDGELAPPRAQFVQAHVAGCAECGGLADGLRSLASAFAEWRVEPAPASLVAPAEAAGRAPISIGSSARRSTGEILWQIVRRPAAGWVAAGLLAASLMLAVIMRNGSQQSDDPYVPGASQKIVDDVSATNGGVVSVHKSELNDKERRQDAQMSLPAGAVASPPPPAAAPVNAPTSALPSVGGSASGQQIPNAAEERLIVRNISLRLSTDRFDDVGAALERVSRAHRGTVAAYSVSGERESGRQFDATVRVPVTEVDQTMVELRAIGTVLSESQSTEEITDAHRDLAIRIANAKREAGRLNELLTRQSDRLSDVLQVEQAQARVQTEIEQMTAQEVAMRSRAVLSTISISVAERYHAQLALGPLPIGTRIRNAMVDGLRGAADSALDTFLTVIGIAPTILVWALFLLPPALIAWWLLGRARSRRLAR